MILADGLALSSAPALASATSYSAADFLRDQTADLHQRAERHAFQRELLGGRLPVAQLAAQLAQQYLIHCRLEQHLATSLRTDPFLHAVVRDYHYRADLIRADLMALGTDTDDLTALPPIERLVSEMHRDAKSKPARLLGYLYVLEGATNGTRIIRSMLLKRLTQLGHSSLASFDPHGDQQVQRWQLFRRELSGLDWPPEELLNLARAAGSVFQTVIDVMGILLVQNGREAARSA